MVGWAEMPRSPGHVFYDRLQSVLIEGGIDGFAEAACRSYYAARLGAPSVPPGRYFRMHLVGYFEGIDSERGLEWRCSDSLSLREFLRLESRDRVPDHSWLSRTRARLPHEVHTAIFDWVLALIAEAGLVKGERIGVEDSTVECHTRRCRSHIRAGVFGRRCERPPPRDFPWRAWPSVFSSGVVSPSSAGCSSARLDHKRKVSRSSRTSVLGSCRADGSRPRSLHLEAILASTHLALRDPSHCVRELLDTLRLRSRRAEVHSADVGVSTTLLRRPGGGQGASRGGNAAPTAEVPRHDV